MLRALRNLIAVGQLLLPLSMGAQVSSTPVPDSTRVALSRQLLELMRAGETAVAAMKANIPAQKKAMPQVPASFWDSLVVRMERELPTLLDSLAPIYAQRFSAEELQGLVAFYRSPLGLHVAAEQPSIAIEGSQLGQRWGERVGSQLARELMSAKPQ